MKQLYISLSIVLSVSTANTLMSQSGSQTFTTSGTFAVPAGVTTVNIQVVGAGGSGGSNGAGGGGGGGYASGAYAVTPLNSIPVTIGTGGSGPSGGTTSVGTLISATGGSNGTNIANPNIGGGGNGGTGIGGTVANRTGGAGGGGYYTYFGGGGGGAAGALNDGSPGGNTIAWSGICITPGGTGGTGGGAPGGNGGKGAGFTDANCNVTDPSAGGSNYGGGGGGANGNGGGPGTGANGYCYISWGTTAIDDISGNENIVIYPNPASNLLHIENINTGINNQYMKIEIINLIGQVVFQSEIKNLKSIIDISSIAKGIYFLQLQTEDGLINKKIVIQ
jgi:hypothetical protein